MLYTEGIGICYVHLKLIHLVPWSILFPMNDFRIEVAETADHLQLSAIAIESKRHWKYPEEWIGGWKEELTIPPDYIKNNFVFKLTDESNHEVVGFCALEWNEEQKELEVAHLWLRPQSMGKNLGNHLLKTSLARVADLPARRVIVTADPNASGFYEKFGFRRTGYTKSTPAGRLLPNLVLEIA